MSRFNRPEPRRCYVMQRINAKRRGVEFKLTYDEWLGIWEASGHFAERGRNVGQYVMARNGDKGAYEVGNVRIIPFEQNMREAWMFRTPEEIECLKREYAKGGYANKGRPRPDLAERNRAGLGQPQPPEIVEKRRQAQLGVKHGPHANKGRPLDPAIVGKRIGKKRGPYQKRQYDNV